MHLLSAHLASWRFTSSLRGVVADDEARERLDILLRDETGHDRRKVALARQYDVREVIELAPQPVRLGIGAIVLAVDADHGELDLVELHRVEHGLVALEHRLALVFGHARERAACASARAIA